MSVMEKLGGAVGAIVGGIFGGPFGPGAGAKAGEFLGGAIDEASAPKPKVVRQAPAPKPAVKSRTIWFNLAVSLGVAVLTWVAGYQWEQIVDPTVGVIIVTVSNVLLRFLSSTAIGRSDEQ